MKKSWFQYFKEIIIFGIAIPIICLFFFYNYLIYLKSNGYNSVLLKMLNEINLNVLNIALNTLLFVCFFCGSILLMFYFGTQRGLVSYQTYDKINLFLIKIGITLFLLIFSSIGLSEAQFSFFTGFVAFFAIIKPFIFKLK